MSEEPRISTKELYRKELISLIERIGDFYGGEVFRIEIDRNDTGDITSVDVVFKYDAVRF